MVPDDRLYLDLYQQNRMAFEHCELAACWLEKNLENIFANDFKSFHTGDIKLVSSDPDNDDWRYPRGQNPFKHVFPKALEVYAMIHKINNERNQKLQKDKGNKTSTNSSVKIFIVPVTIMRSPHLGERVLPEFQSQREDLRYSAKIGYKDDPSSPYEFDEIIDLELSNSQVLGLAKSYKWSSSYSKEKDLDMLKRSGTFYYYQTEHRKKYEQYKAQKNLENNKAEKRDAVELKNGVERKLVLDQVSSPSQPPLAVPHHLALTSEQRGTTNPSNTSSKVTNVSITTASYHPDQGDVKSNLERVAVASGNNSNTSQAQSSEIPSQPAAVTNTQQGSANSPITTAYTMRTDHSIPTAALDVSAPIRRDTKNSSSTS